MASWSNEEIFRFIDNYHNEPVLWNPKHEQHKNKTRVNDAWSRIADNMNIPVTELKKKKESLMATYRMHRKKKIQSIKSGMGEDECYNPIWPFYEPMDNFLNDVYECSSIINTEGSSASSSTCHVEDDSQGSNSVAASSSNLGAVPVLRRRSKNPPELAEAGREMSNAFNTLNQVLKDDPCDLYGKLLATKLRKYTEIEREEIMLEIDNMLLNRHQKAQLLIRRNSVIRPPSSLSSHGSEWSYSPPSPPSPQNRPSSAHTPSFAYYVPNQQLPRRVQIISNEVLTPAQIHKAQSSPNPTHPPLQELLESPVTISIPELSQHTMADHNYTCEGYNSSETHLTPIHNILNRAYTDA